MSDEIILTDESESALIQIINHEASIIMDDDGLFNEFINAKPSFCSAIWTAIGREIVKRIESKIEDIEG